MKYKVCWYSKLTDAQGEGNPMDYYLAVAWAESGNRKYPDIHHWVEPENKKALEDESTIA